MALVADSWDDLKAMLDTMAECCKGLGLSISCTKTKTMAILPDLFPRPEPVHLFPNDAPVEVVSHIQYLVSIVQDNCGSDLEADFRICKALKAFQSLSHILGYQWKIKPCTKLHILSTFILPTLLYGLESTLLHEQKIQRKLCHALAQDHSWGVCQGHEAQYHLKKDGQTAKAILSAHAADFDFCATCPRWMTVAY